MADDLDQLVAQFTTELKTVMNRFSGLDWQHVDTETLINAQSRIPAGEVRDEFATEYMFLQGIWEAAAPHNGLLPLRPAYRFLSQVYSSVTPSDVNDHIWHRLGAKTLEIVHGHTHGVHVTGGFEFVVTDADAQQLLDEGLIAEKEEAQHKSPKEIVDGIAARLQKRLEGDNGEHPVYRSLAERLEKLRLQSAAAVQQSIEWLREAFQLANDVVAAEHAEEKDGAKGLGILPDPRINALTQIFNEFAPADSPELMGLVVHEVDKVVTQVRFDGWKADPEADRLVKRNLRTILRKFQLHKTPGLFDRAYQYIAQHY